MAQKSGSGASQADIRKYEKKIEILQNRYNECYNELERYKNQA